jgi:hypothetical protein
MSSKPEKLLLVAMNPSSIAEIVEYICTALAGTMVK